MKKQAIESIFKPNKPRMRAERAGSMHTPPNQYPMNSGDGQ